MGQICSFSIHSAELAVSKTLITKNLKKRRLNDLILKQNETIKLSLIDMFFTKEHHNENSNYDHRFSVTDSIRLASSLLIQIVSSAIK